MKIFICLMLLVSYCGKTAKAQEGNNPETKPESDISANTKQVLRKIGRKSMDTTCELTKSKEECAKEKAAHQKAAAADKLAYEKRQTEKAARKKAKEDAKAETKAQMKAKQELEEKDCHEVDGKLQCAGKKAKNKIKSIVQ